MVCNKSRVSYWVLTSHQPHRVLSGRDISRARRHNADDADGVGGGCDDDDGVNN